EDTAIKIDQEINQIVMGQYERARRIILGNGEAVERLAQTLLEYESLDAIQIRRVVTGLPLGGEIPLLTPTGQGESADKKPVLKPYPAADWAQPLGNSLNRLS